MANNEEQKHALKDKLKELVNTIAESDDFTVHAADEAITALSVLRDMKCSASFSRKLDHLSLPVPPQFRCPISGLIMTDPVILAIGQVIPSFTLSHQYNDHFLNAFFTKDFQHLHNNI
jgi:hypothetical protein